MPQPTKKTTEELFKSSYAKNSTGNKVSDFITETSGANASVSEQQLGIAEKGNSGSQESVISAFAEQNVQNNLKIKEQAEERRKYLAQPQNRLEEVHKEALGEKGFVDFKEKTEKLKDKEARINQLKNKSTDFFDEGGVNLLAPFYKVRDLFVDDKNKWGKTEGEEEELKDLVLEKDSLSKDLGKQLRPTVQKISKGLKEQQALNEVKIKNLVGTIPTSDNKDMSFGDLLSKIYSFKTVKEAFSPGEDGNPLDEIALIKSANRKMTSTIKYADDFLAGKNNIWDGLNNKKDLATLGLYEFTEELVYKTHSVNKLNRLMQETGDYKTAFDKLSDGEQQVLLADATHTDLREGEAFSSIHNGRDFYETADGVGSSLVFMEQLLYTGGVTQAVGKGLTQGVLKGVTESLLKNTVKKSVARKLGLVAIDKGAQLTGLALATPLSPSTWTSAMKEHNGPMEIIEDNDGTKRVILGDGLFKSFKREYGYKKSLINQEKKNLQNKDNLSDSDQERLDNLLDQEENLDNEYNSIRPKSWMESAVYGYTENFKEQAIEMYGGALGEKVLGKAMGWIGKTKLGKFISKPTNLTTKAYKAISNTYKEGADRIGNSLIGKISSKAAYRTGSSQVVSGIPGEVFEEILSQATPSLNRDYSDQLAQLKDPSFYSTVIAQTALMGGGFASIGAVSKISNWKANGKFYDARKQIINKYRSIDKAITDDDLANTIAMASAGTNYSMGEYEAKIQDLRDKNQTKLANELEQKKFVNMATIALQTGTLDHFEQSLDNVIKNTKGSFSAETLNNATLAKEKIAKIKETYNRYSDRANVGTIVDLASKKLAVKQGLDNINTEIGTQKTLANEELQTILTGVSLKNTPLSHLQTADLDTILDYTPVNDEEAVALDKFVATIDSQNGPAISSYINLLETKEELRYAQKKNMELFNEEVSPNRVAQIEKKKSITRAINKQLKDTIAFGEENGISAPGLEIDAMGKAVVSKDFIEHSFKNVLDTYGLSAKELAVIKQEYLDKIDLQEAAKRQQASSNIANLYDQSKIIIDKQKETAQNEEISLFEKEQPEATEEEKQRYEDNVDQLREILLSHPIALENKGYDKEYIASVETNLHSLVDLAETQTLSAENIKEIFPSYSDIQTQVLSNVINDYYILPENKNSQVEAPINNIETVAQATVTAQANISSVVAPDMDPDAISADEDNLLSDFKLMPALKAEGFDENQMKGLKKVIFDFNSSLTDELGRKPSFKEMVYHFIKFTDKVQTEKFFDAYRVGWEANGFEATNYNEVFNEIFEPSRNAAIAANAFIESLYSTGVSVATTEEEVIQSSEKQLQEVQSSQATVTDFTEENVPIKTENENRISSPALRLGFNAIKYDEVEVLDAQGHGTNTFKRVAVITDTLNEENPLIDYKELLDPDKNNAGSVLNVGMAPENMWPEIMISVGRDAHSKPILKSFEQIFNEKLATNPDFKGSAEFIEIVPMFAYNSQGVAVAYIHEAGWYNEWNVKDPTSATGIVNPRNINLAHKEAIEDAKVKATNFREAVHGGLSQVTIKEKAEGAFYSIANRKDDAGNKIPLYTIEEANPQSEFAIQGKQNILEQGVDKPFENDKRVIINKKEIAEKKQGVTWHLRRIGTNPEGQETWRAFGVVRYPNEEELETVRWAWSAYSLFDHKETLQGAKKAKVIQEVRAKFLPTQYSLTEDKAREIIKEIKTLTGYNLMEFEDAMAYFNLFIQPRTGNTPAEFGRTLYTGELSGFAQHTLRDGLSKNPTIPMIKNGEVVSTNKRYTDYLKGTLKTDVKSFNIGTSDKPVYVTSIQPKIVFEYETGQQENTPAKEIAKAKQVAEEVKQEVVSTQSTKELLELANGLINELGFSFEDVQAMPVEMNGVDHLKNILNLTPGLSIEQEYQLLNFTVQYINNLIDSKFKGKINKALLMKELSSSYSDIVGPSVDKVKAVLTKLESAPQSEDVAKAIGNYKAILRVFNNLEKNWNAENIKSTLEISGEAYNGQIGIVEKALQEAAELADIQEGEVKLEEEEEDDLSLSEKSFDDAASMTENFKTKTTFRQKRFMSGVSKVDTKGDAIKGFLGLPQYMDYNEVYDAIYSLLGSGVYIESDYETMKARLLQMKDAHPWVKELVDKYDNADTQLRKGLVLNYRKHAISMKFMMYDNRGTGSRLQVYDTNANEITRVIRGEWMNNFITSPLVLVDNGQYTINRDVAKALLDEFNSWGTEGHLQSDATVRTWLSNFGIELTDGYWNELKEVGMMNNGKYIPYSQLFSSPNTPMGFLGIYLNRVANPNNVDYIKDLRFEENEKAHPFKDMQGVLKALSKGESRFTSKILSKSFRDAQKSITGITNPTYITNRVDDLIRSGLTEEKEFINQLSSLSISHKSVMLELMKEYPDFAKKLELNHLGLTAIKEYGKKANAFSSITNLNSVDHDLTKLGFFQDQQQGEIPSRIKVSGFKMRMARMFLPTMSDKSQMYTLTTGVFDFMKQSNSAFQTGKEGEVVFTDDLRNLLYERLVLPELTRIANFHKNVKSTTVKDYDKAAQIFNFIPALNNLKDANGYRIIEHLTTKSAEEVEALYKEDMMNVVENVMHTLAEEKLSEFDSFLEKDTSGTITKVNFFDASYMASNPSNITLEQRFKQATYDYVLNSVLTNADTFVTIAGDPAFFSQDKLFEKNTPAYAMSSDSAYINLAKKQGVNIGKRLAYLSAPGTTLADSKDQKYKQVFLKDSKDISENSKYLISLYYGKASLKEDLLDTVEGTVEKMIDTYESLTPAMQSTVRDALANKFPTLGDYFDIESTDAQEYTTVKEHVGILFNQERLSQAQYDNIMAKIDNNEDLGYENLGLVLQPIKPVYTGQIIDASKDMSRVVYVKSSAFPLIPELTAGTKLDNLRVSLEKLEKDYKMPVRASYQSANKVGSVIDALTIDPLNEESLKGIESSMLEMNRNDFRIQQDVPFKSDKKKEDKIAMGTQIFKLLFGDGILNLENFNFKGETLTGEQLYDKFNETFQGIVKGKKIELYNELGLNEEGVPVDEQETIKKVQKLLQKEAMDRNYPMKDIKGLELQTLYDTQGNPYYEFNIPLWLSTNSNRYESLLNAIINNRLISYKIPGNSFVAASENGFAFQENMKGIDRSRVIYMDNWNGKQLKGVLHDEADENGVRQFKKAQVFVPSKFKNADGKLIDLFAKSDDGDHIYLEKRENGTWRLKDGMIETELLNQFSYRTPTSSHVSASTIEIAGILPPEVGDLMIVPKNFTKQKGLDFDVDKENVYQLNHVTNYATGKVEVLSEAHRDRALQRLSEILELLDLEKIQLQRKMLPEEAAKLLGDYGTDKKINLAQYFGQEMLDKVLSEEASTQQKFNTLEAEFNQKLLENDFIRIHNSVYNNPDAEVQKKINKVLSMDFARGQASLIEELVEESKVKSVEVELVKEGVTDAQAKGLASTTTNNFTILSDQYQKAKMGLGSAGKMGIGVYSNYVTLHALIQQTRKPVTMIDFIDDNGNVNYKQINIGGINSKGILGLVNTLDGSRSIAEAFAEKQNTATDNEKEQILGRVNINSTTIGVDSLLTLLGYDKTKFSDKGETKDLSVSYALLSQPIIKEYVELMQRAKGVTAEYNANAEEEIIEKLYSKYAVEGINLEDLTGSVLTGDNLVDGIRNNGKRKDVQAAALKTFLDLADYAKNMAKVQSVIGLRNLGKSIVESNLKYDDLVDLGNNIKFNNITSLVGDFVKVSETTARPEGYQVIGNFYVKPTTPQGSIVVSGLVASKTLWSDFFPYSDPYIQMAIQNIVETSGTPSESKFKKIEVYQDVFDEVRKYINSWNKFGLFNGTATTERQRLFMDTADNMSLANYLNSNSKVPALSLNKLLNRFSYEIEVDGRPSLIKYNNTISDDLNEKYLYNAFAEMMVNDKPLPDWNGQPFSTKSLAQELITYSYVEGGVQEAIQFIKYVPLEYLQEVGIKENGQFVSAASLLQRMNTKRNPLLFKHLLGDASTPTGKNLFVKQYFQHHPEKTAKLDTKGVDLKADSFVKLGLDFYPPFYHVRNKTKSKLKQDKFTLYQHLGLGQYTKISVLGASGMNEYQAGFTNVNSVISKQKYEELPTDPQPTQTDTQTAISIKDGMTATDLLDSVAKSLNPANSRYKAIASALLPYLPTNLSVTVGDSKQVFGKAVSGFYNDKTNTLFIDPVLAKNVKGKEVGVFMHELVHALTVKELKKYYSVDTEGYYTVLADTAPAHVKALHSVWQEVIATLDPKLIEDTKTKIDNLRTGQAVTLTTEELNLGYAAIDIFEFMAVSMESEMLQKHMADTPYQGSNKSILAMFMDAIKNILKSISPEIKEGSLAEASLTNILDFLQAEKEIKEVNEQSAIFDSLDVNVSEAEKTIAEMDLSEREEVDKNIDLSSETTEAPEDSLLPCEGGIGI